MTEQCNRCRFWKDEPRYRDPNDDDWSFGLCRRSPPVLSDAMLAATMPRPVYGQQIDSSMDALSLMPASLWPATHSQDWCGDFARRRGEGPGA